MGCAVIVAANLRNRSGKPKQLRVKVVGDRCITRHFLDDKCLRPELLGGAYQAVASTSRLEAARDQLEGLPSLNIKKARAFVRELVIREVNVDEGYETDVPGSKFYQNVYSRWKDRRPTWWPFDDFSCRDLNNCNKADLEGLGKTLLKRRIDRLQASGADGQQQHVAACDGRRHPSELRPKHKQENEDPDQQVQDLSPEDLIDMVTNSVESDADAIPSDDELDDVVDVVKAPSLNDARQPYRSLAAFLADNTDYTAQDEVFFQRLIDKAAKIGVIRINQRRQQSIT